MTQDFKSSADFDGYVRIPEFVVLDAISEIVQFIDNCDKTNVVDKDVFDHYRRLLAFMLRFHLIDLLQFKIFDSRFVELGELTLSAYK